MTDPSGASDMLGSAITATIEGIGNTGLNWLKWWLKYRRGQNPQKLLDEMLRNPKWRFRETARLAAKINDTTAGYSITTIFLREMGAHHNIKLKDARDTWWMPKYWEEDASGHGSTKDGKWKLRKGITPGNT
jgi:hypothetical protein